MNIYQKKLTKVSKLLGINYELLIGDKKSFGWYRKFYKLKNKIANELYDDEKVIIDIYFLKTCMCTYKEVIEDNIIEKYKKILNKKELSECEEELAIEIAYLKYSKPYRTKKQYRILKKNKYNRL